MSAGPHAWSTDPASNGTIDTRAQFPVGMNANALDNSLRGLMASVALARDDNLGASLTATLPTGNTTNGYVLSTGQGLIDPSSTVGGAAARITHPFSLRVNFAVAPTGMATNPLKLALDGAAAATVTRADGSALVDGDIVTGKSYPIVGYAFTNGVLTQIRVISILPSEVNALADARVNAALPAIIASIGSPVQKTGDTMSGNLSITGAFPSLSLVYPGVLNGGWQIQPDARLSWRNFTSGAEYFSVGANGAVSTAQLGDLNTRIESRASAYAVQQAQAYTNNCVQSARWVYAGQKLCWENPGTGGFISPFGGQAMSCDYWTSAFVTADGQNLNAPFAYRYRNLQIYVPNQGWVTVGAAS